MTWQIPRHLLTGALAVAVFYGLLGTEVQCTTAEARPSLASLQAQIEALQSDSLIVIDGNGDELGPYIDYLGVGEFRVFFEALSAILLVNAEFGLVVGVPRSVFFDLPNCEGQPYASQSILNALLIAGPTNARRFFVPADAPLVGTIEVASILGGSTTCQNTPSSGGTDVMLLDEVTDSPFLTLQFEPPFQIVTRAEVSP